MAIAVRRKLPVRCGIPHCSEGLKVGLFGGSFDPPHSGHRAATLCALKRIELDRIWWLFSAGNPLKHWKPASIEARMTASREVLDHPRVVFSDLEARSGIIRTVHTIEMLQDRFPSAKFVWLMGSDSLAEFHCWEGWREIFMRVPVGVLSRRPGRFAAMNAVAARTFAGHRVSDASARHLAEMKPPAWAAIRMAFDDSSSTCLRSDSGQVT